MTSTRPLRVATFNICSGRIDGVPGQPAQLEAAIAELGADVVAVQEVDRGQERSGGRNQAQDAAAGLGPDAHWRFAATLTGTPGFEWEPVADPDSASETAPTYGIALLSRYPVLHWEHLTLAPAPVRSPLVLPNPAGGSGAPGRPGVVLLRDEPRVALAAVIDAPVGPITVVATHLSFTPGWNLRQLRQIRTWMRAEQQAHRFPRALVLAGDLNLPGRVPALATGLQRGVIAPTFPAARPRIQLDHLLPSPAVQLQGGRAVRLPISDHCALIADVTLR